MIATAPAAHAASTEKVSVTSDGANATGHSHQPSLSDDGRFVAFDSTATNLDPQGRTGVFLRDRQAGTTTWLAPGNNAHISGDGATVVFFSYALLVPGQSPDGGYGHAFAIDVATREIEMLDVTPDGGHPGPYHTGPGPTSRDGRYVLLGGSSPHLVAGDTNNFPDVFVRDRLNDTTERVSLTQSGGQLSAVGGVGSCDISADGRFVSFQAEGNGVVPEDDNNTADVFVRDRRTGAVEIVSVSPSGALGDRYSSCGTLSADGNLVTFHSHSSNFGDGSSDAVYVRDRTAGSTRRVSETADGAATGASRYPQISGDGRFVTFLSWGDNLVPGDTNFAADIFVRDLATGAIDRVSVSSTGEQTQWEPGMAVINGDGRFVAFTSRASNLVPDDTDSCIGYEYPDRDEYRYDDDEDINDGDGDGGGGSSPEPREVPEHCTDIFLRDRLAATNTAADEVAPGDSVSTNSAVTAEDPVGTTVTSPVAGTVSIVESQATDAAPSGYSFISGQQVNIEAPQATAANPLRLVFRIDDSVLPAGADASSLEVFRNGSPIADCSGPTGTASPDPCVAERVALDGGGVQLAILTSHASHWNFGLHQPYAFGGLRFPASKPALTYKAGMVVPVRFGLGGYHGLDVLASGFPRSRPCGSTGAGTRTTGSLKYDQTKQQYVYAWTTEKGWGSASGGGPCREFSLGLNDGTVHRADVRFVR